MSKKLKLSPWHDGSVKPVHKGVYEISRIDGNPKAEGTMFSYFDGKHWYGWIHPTGFKRGEHPNSKRNRFFIAGQKRDWRGVLK